MVWGAVTLLAYSILVCQLLMRSHWNALPASLAALGLWLVVALGSLLFISG